MNRILFVCANIGALVACNGGAEAEGDTTATGAATYEDAGTDTSGQPSEPAAPPAQDDMVVTIDIGGTGTLSGLQPECELEGATGQFAGLLEGTGSIDGNGVYVAAFASEEGSFTTPSGACDIPDLSIGTVTDVVVRAELENTQQNCETYCEAKASAAAEEECGADASAAGCRGEMEASYASSCQTECTGSTTRRIVAETSLGVDALATLNASELSGTGLGAVEADLTFDHIEEEDGTEVDEAP